DLFNLVGLWIYLLSGSESVHPIEFYNSVARRFVDEGSNPVRLRASWGSVLFGSGAVDRVISILRASPQTRRAVIPVLRVEDLGVASRNLPCLTAVQFSVQGGRLDCYVTMRSQAAMGVMPYDLFLLTMLHEYVAMRTGIPLGEYTHFAPLCGIRESEAPFLADTASSPVMPQTMPPMEKLEDGKLALFHYCERKIRNTGTLPEEINQLPNYWRDFLSITFVKKCLKTQNEVAARRAALESITTFPREFLDKNFRDE
ncbi:MAG TPA: thymidylate synthase, partial [Patescibacteria group bacterium]|nr:thymidylate synthase [Patescibacteria group bacterium]